MVHFFCRLAAGFFQAQSFLTTIPVPAPLQQRAFSVSSHWAMLAYPFIGFMIGCIVAVVGILFQAMSPSLTAGLMLAAWVLVTGGLHLDGVADVSDAWMAGFKCQDPEQRRQRMLKIMKDPTIGAMGCIAIVLTLLIKWLVIRELLLSPISEYSLYLLILAAMIARGGSALIVISTPYARLDQGGLGVALQSDSTEKKQLLCVYGLLVVLMFAFMLSEAGSMLAIMLSAFVAVIVFAVGLRSYCINLLAGYTGDILGLQIELSESIFLLLCLFMVPLLSGLI